MQGKISYFGGADDKLVKHDEGLALFNRYDDFPEIFLTEAPDLMPDDPGYPGKATGLARRLDVSKHWCAMRWDYSKTPKPILRHSKVMISANGEKVFATPCDYGPALWTDRIIDCSESVLKALRVQTDDVVKCVLMLPEDVIKHGITV